MSVHNLICHFYELNKELITMLKRLVTVQTSLKKVVIGKLIYNSYALYFDQS